MPMLWPYGPYGGPQVTGTLPSPTSHGLVQPQTAKGRQTSLPHSQEIPRLANSRKVSGAQTHTHPHFISFPASSANPPTRSTTGPCGVPAMGHHTRFRRIRLRALAVGDVIRQRTGFLCFRFAVFLGPVCVGWMLGQAGRWLDVRGGLGAGLALVVPGVSDTQDAYPAATDERTHGVAAAAIERSVSAP